jgi:hypothetical protein
MIPAGFIFVSLALPAFAQQPLTMDVGTLGRESAEKAFQKPPYSPNAGRNFPTRPFFSDTRLRTSFSMDAEAFGARLGPKGAYPLAKGEDISASSDQLVKLSRPLDFLVVADHSDNMGFFPVYPPLGSDTPRDRWKWRAAYEERTVGDVLAIAHNGNLSNGRMFPIIESFTGKPIDRDDAETRGR